MTAGIPFAGEIDFRYRPDRGDVKTTVVKFECAPAGVTNAAPPTIMSLTVQPPSGELPAGAPLNVNFNVTAPAGPVNPPEDWSDIFMTSGGLAAPPS